MESWLPSTNAPSRVAAVNLCDRVKVARHVRLVTSEASAWLRETQKQQGDVIQSDPEQSRRARLKGRFAQITRSIFLSCHLNRLERSPSGERITKAVSATATIYRCPLNTRHTRKRTALKTALVTPLKAPKLWLCSPKHHEWGTEKHIW